MMRKTVSNNRQTVSLICLISFFALSVQVFAADALRPYTATYQSTWDIGFFPITLTAEKKLKQVRPGLWELTFEMESKLADYKEISRFKQTREGIKTISYEFKQGGLLETKDVDLTFDYENNLIVPQTGKPRKLIKGKMYDRLSYQAEMRYLVKDPLPSITFHVAEEKKNKTYKFKQLPSEKIKTKAGTYNAKVYRFVDKHHRDRDLDRVTTIWLAKELDYNPVKVQQTFQDQTHTVELDSFKYLD